MLEIELAPLPSQINPKEQLTMTSRAQQARGMRFLIVALGSAGLVLKSRRLAAGRLTPDIDHL
jgi:hypothetical protein